MSKLVASVSKPLRTVGELASRQSEFNSWRAYVISCYQVDLLAGFALVHRRHDFALLTPVMMNARFAAGSKYLTVVSSVEGNVFSKRRARSGFLRRAFMSSITFYNSQRCQTLWSFSAVRFARAACLPRQLGC